MYIYIHIHMCVYIYIYVIDIYIIRVLDGYAHEARLDEGDKEVLPLDRRLQRTWGAETDIHVIIHA